MGGFQGKDHDDGHRNGARHYYHYSLFGLAGYKVPLGYGTLIGVGLFLLIVGAMLFLFLFRFETTASITSVTATSILPGANRIYNFTYKVGFATFEGQTTYGNGFSGSGYSIYYSLLLPSVYKFNNNINLPIGIVSGILALSGAAATAVGIVGKIKERKVQTEFK